MYFLKSVCFLARGYTFFFFNLQLDFMPLLGILIFSGLFFQEKYSWHNINEVKEMLSSCQISSVHEEILCD